MAPHTANILDLCAGTGMLGVGTQVALSYLGFESRTVAYCERDPFCAAVLVARMEDEALDPAPIWDDVATFPSRAFCGLVDCVVAGFPCQDLSCSGHRRGLEGGRSAVFYDVLRVAQESRAPLIFLENVEGILSTPTSHVYCDEERMEPTGSAVGKLLAEAGYDSSWSPVRASDTGAPHQRSRWFCLAVANALCSQWPKTRPCQGLNTRSGPKEGRRDLGDEMERPLYPPDPDDNSWNHYLRREPCLKPALHRVADGVDDELDRLRAIGNGVVPLQAAAAFVTLWHRWEAILRRP